MEIPVVAEIGGVIDGVVCEPGAALNVGDPVATLACAELTASRVQEPGRPAAG